MQILFKCLKNFYRREVRIGDHNLITQEDCMETNSGDVTCYPYIVTNVESIIIHPGYVQTTKEHDIALIRLNETIDMHAVRGMYFRNKDKTQICFKAYKPT